MADNSDLLARYEQELAAHGYQPDAAQRAALARLQTLRTRVLEPPKRALAERLRILPLLRGLPRRGTGADLLSQPPGHRGVYLWGGVGRGKTWLTDLFFDSLPQGLRRRAHFHHFMRDVHDTLRQMRARRAPLELVARRLASRTRVLCLDELYVSDIADAMILGTLFESLLREGVYLVITSNVPPSGLYRDGLQRARFLPAIRLLDHALELIGVDSGIDYRLRTLRRQPIYLDSAGASHAHLQALFESLATTHGDTASELSLQGRTVRALRRRGDVVWFDFATLCEGPRSQNDYVELGEEFGTLLLSNVPSFTRPEQDNAARRFIALIDELYDQRVKVIVSAAAPPAELYRCERLKFEFHRTASRLTEMQTDEYLARPHRA